MTLWLLPFTIPLFIQGYIVAGLAYCCGLWGRAEFRNGILVCEWRPWFARRWPFVTTIAYAMGAREGGPSDQTWRHEVVHVRQAEDLVVLSAVVGAIVAIWNPWLGLGLWLSGGPLWQLPNFLTALPRYRSAGRALNMQAWEIMYYGSSHELHAYAETNSSNWPP